MVRKATHYSGKAGFDKAEEEVRKNKERAKQRQEGGHMPFRFFVSPGDTKEFIVVDDDPTFFRYEHNLKDPHTHKWSVHTGCVKEFDNCPVCEAEGKESYYAMYLTIIDLTPFKDRKGNKHEFSRKLLVVKAGQQKKFQRALAKAEKEGMTLRGALFETTRDGDRESAIGNDIELIEWLSEEELLEYERTWKDQNGKSQTEKAHEPFDYEKLFPETTAKELRATVGGSPTPGSREADEEELGSRRPARRRKAGDEEEEEDSDWARPERSERMSAKRKASSTSRRKVRDVDEDDEEEEEDGDTPVREKRAVTTRPTGTRPSSTRRGRVKEEEEDEEEEEEDEEEAPVRKAARKKAVTGRPTSRRRAVEEEEEDDEEEEEAPNRRNPRRVSMRKRG